MNLVKELTPELGQLVPELARGGGDSMISVDPTTEEGYAQWLTLLHSGYVVVDILDDGKEVLQPVNPGR